MQELVRFYA